jgi:hypothetical protein
MMSHIVFAAVGDGFRRFLVSYRDAKGRPQRWTVDAKSSAGACRALLAFAPDASDVIAEVLR